MNHSAFTLIALPFVCIGLIGCGDPLVEAQLIGELRVLGAQAYVEGDPSRATPAPGDTLRVDWLVADGEGPSPDIVWQLELCEAAKSNRGVPYCEGESLAQASQTDPGPNPPSIGFSVPDEDTGRLLVHGIVCDGGTPELDDDPAKSSCGEGMRTQRVSLLIFPQAERDNQNPTLDGAALRFNTDPWPETADCTDPDAVHIDIAKTAHDIELELPEDAQQTYEEELGDQALELLQLSAFSDGGLFERRFYSPEAAGAPSFLLGFTGPETSDRDSLNFYFVVRDGRGGLSWLTRTLCLDP